ncbi:hypothetical protein R5R35_003542 [Gryllus longicercus]|uniref:Accessory gland protein n=1 Tax=Gryllus longicercus TaxID=2509291 RepID=A0AAN9VK86_9ORTH
MQQRCAGAVVAAALAAAAALMAAHVVPAAASSSSSASSSANAAAGLDLVYGTYQQCEGQADALGCLKLQAIKVMHRALSQDSLPITEGLTLVRSEGKSRWRLEGEDGREEARSTWCSNLCRVAVWENARSFGLFNQQGLTLLQS